MAIERTLAIIKPDAVAKNHTGKILAQIEDNHLRIIASKMIHLTTEKAEKFYLTGLKIKPDHKGINEYLGELYVQTNRIDKANERLEVLKNCNCKEYEDLKAIIAGEKVSKY